jgi:hypothetical protein
MGDQEVGVPLRSQGPQNLIHRHVALSIRPGSPGTDRQMLDRDPGLAAVADPLEVAHRLSDRTGGGAGDADEIDDLTVFSLLKMGDEITRGAAGAPLRIDREDHGRRFSIIASTAWWQA